MKALTYLAVGLLILSLSVTAMAQKADKVEVKQATDKYDLGLAKRPSLPFFDLSRLNLSHSYSIGFFSGGGQSGTRGLYSGTLYYQLARPLTLTLNLSVLHDPGALFGDGRFSDNARFLPSGWLDWRPSKNFRMSIGFETVPMYYDRGYDYYSGRSLYWYR
jgi:hypothetical protein